MFKNLLENLSPDERGSNREQQAADSHSLFFANGAAGDQNKGLIMRAPDGLFG
jgi:hypothetical protein